MPLLGLSHPSVVTPFEPPRQDAIQKVLAVGDEQYLTRLFEGLESFDRRCNLHPVVCRLGSATRAFQRVFGIAKNVSPPTRSGVAYAGPVCN